MIGPFFFGSRIFRAFDFGRGNCGKGECGFLKGNDTPYGYTRAKKHAKAFYRG